MRNARVRPTIPRILGTVSAGYPTPPDIFDPEGPCEYGIRLESDALRRIDPRLRKGTVLYMDADPPTCSSELLALAGSIVVAAFPDGILVGRFHPDGEDHAKDRIEYASGRFAKVTPQTTILGAIKPESRG